MTLKNKFKHCLPYTWYLYLIALVIPCVAFPFSFSYMHRPQAYEKINLFVSNNILKSGLNNYLYEKLKDNGVQQVDIVSCNFTDSIYLQKLTVVGYSSSDIMIIPSTLFQALNFPIVMQEINEDIKTKCGLQSATFHKVDDKDYGVKVSSNLYINTFLDYDSSVDYYAFINGSSYNIGSYSTKNPQTENAFKALKVILGN